MVFEAEDLILKSSFFCSLWYGFPRWCLTVVENGHERILEFVGQRIPSRRSPTISRVFWPLGTHRNDQMGDTMIPILISFLVF